MSIRELEGIDERWVGGWGNRQSPAIAYVAEAPSFQEVRVGAPLVGPSGDINWQFAARYGGVYRNDNYVTNWSKIPLTKETKEKMPLDGMREWTSLLDEELAAVRPTTVVALGGYAVNALLGPGHSLFWSNGIPIDRGDFVVIPVVHPAAGMHESTMLARTAQGYAGVRRYLAGEISARSWKQWAPDPVTVQWDPASMLRGQWLAVDTEGSKEDPYCITFAQEPGIAHIIYAHEKTKIREFKRQVEATRPTWVLHHSLHDAGVVRSITGINIWDYEVEDTMVEAYILQDIPRGLKDLTRKQLNINMEDYEDVVAPWAKIADDRWLAQAYTYAISDLSLDAVLTPKGKPRMSKGSPVMKWNGPEPQQAIRRHVEREQQLHPQELAWAETRVGKRPGMELKWVPEEIAKAYAGKDAAVTIANRPVLRQRVRDEGLEEVYQTDHKVLPITEDMQNVGMHIDVDRFWEVLGDIGADRLDVEDTIRTLVHAELPGTIWTKTGNPDDFNPGSSDQVAEFCRLIYKRDGLLGIDKRTKSGLRDSTDDEVLDQLRDDHPFIGLELEYRELVKFESTYLLPLMPQIKETSDGYRVFVRLNATSVVSGRFSSGGRDAFGHKSINALAWPARTELGLKIRSPFTAPAGRVLGSWDLSQIELRLAAAFSGDPTLTQAFNEGLDPHSFLASKLFGVGYAEADIGTGRLIYRKPAKNINYMLVYGGTWQKLFTMMKGAMSREQCQEMFNDTWKIYKVLGEWLDEAGDEARRLGYVSDFSGRRRFLPGAQLDGDQWPVVGLRYEAERQGGNHKVQGGTSKILKDAMYAVWSEVYPEMKRRGIKFRLWLQIHDELMGELQEDAWEIVNPMMIEIMQRGSWLTSPIKIETTGKFGHCWADLK